MSDLEAVGQAFEVTVNDVLLAAVSGALRGYLGLRGELPPEPLVAGVPVSTHQEGDGLSNSYSGLFANLATHLEEPVERLLAIHDSAQHAKGRQGVIGGQIVRELADIPAPWLYTMAFTVYSRLGLSQTVPPLCNVVVSNVTGPPTYLYFGGARVVGLYPLGPIFDGMVLNVTAISCGDALDIGLVTCPDRLPDLWSLADAIPAALAELTARLPREGEAHG